ncbi:uncharacterized protein N7443_007911 [Penicillium atrosanguineum]|uniref:uncharacterized protein n=1 Tax=Penicillium atrosanguineum TaxID=1132637 RepID=UPI0023A12FDA|nr:uncharacterized protein N7443_007911 [Penicillium atrosanguineum]KAJ5297018.1 hypothetical protein N7443_007911 [Penicillium atrosanguineum]
MSVGRLGLGCRKSASASLARDTAALKPRSCVVCRTRKVRCDKQSPCSNCRRANIACVVPSKDRPPRWTRRLERPATGEIMERLRDLENLVKDLSGQLEQANAAVRSTAGSSSGVGSPESSMHDADHSLSASSARKLGRLVAHDSNRSRYVGNSFWSRVNDELEELKMDAAAQDSDMSDDAVSYENTPSTQELDRTPSERHAFLFKHNLASSGLNSTTPDLREFHPLPSQIPFLLDVYSENINVLGQVVHMPTIKNMVRDLRGDVTKLTPANEALLFSIYYAAVTSMEEDDVNINFGCKKAELNLKYRLGTEHALAKADFLNVPDLVLIQASTIFITLLRRHDSPRFVWMMAGLVIRMALALGLHRDGTNFQHLTPFEIEMRRRVWWVICALDVRASEDQGTEFTITTGSFDTKIPLNINDGDISPDTKEMPQELEGLSDMSFARVTHNITGVARQIMAPGLRKPSLEEQSQLLQEIYRTLEQNFLQYSTESNIIYWVGVTIARLVMAKTTLFIYLPVLYESRRDTLSAELRTKLLIAAIEVAEYNHALNAEQACRHWRWVYQTYTHWHAIVYILIEISRRPWSPLVERAWVALHSVWLIPSQSHMGKQARIWFPLRKLMSKAKKHQQIELERLRSDPEAVALLESEYRTMALPSSPIVPTSSGSAAAGFSSAGLALERWRQLVIAPMVSTAQMSEFNIQGSSYRSIPGADASSLTAFDPGPAGSTSQPDQNLLSANFTNFQTSTAPSPTGSQGNLAWLWSDNVFTNAPDEMVDINMDLDADIDWYNWVESAKGAEVNGPGT